MKKKLYDTKKLVKQVLEDSEEARNSDSALYVQICHRLNPQALRIPFAEVVSDLEGYGLPPFETVRRTRQKIQAECPHLRSCEEVQLFRAKNETAYHDFAIN